MKPITTAAQEETPCPRCGAQPGEACSTPAGRRAKPHGERTRAYRNKIGGAEFDRRHAFKTRGVDSVLSRFESQIPGFIVRKPEGLK